MEFFLFLLWILFAVLVATLGKKRKIGFGLSLLLAILLSPLVGLIIVLLSKEITEDEIKNSSKSNVQRYREFLDIAEREHFKENLDNALENYLDALFYLKKDYTNLNEKDEQNRQNLIDKIQSKINEIKEVKEKK